MLAKRVFALYALFVALVAVAAYECGVAGAAGLSGGAALERVEIALGCIKREEEAGKGGEETEEPRDEIGDVV